MCKGYSEGVIYNITHFMLISALHFVKRFFFYASLLIPPHTPIMDLNLHIKIMTTVLVSCYHTI